MIAWLECVQEGMGGEDLERIYTALSGSFALKQTENGPVVKEGEKWGLKKVFVMKNNKWLNTGWEWFSREENLMKLEIDKNY